jgi:hypothetical protein
MEIKIEFEIFPDGRLNSLNAAKYLGISPKTLAMLRCRGESPEYIKRGRIFYFKEDLDSWLISDGKRTSTAKSA